jgi:antitoxin component YwqK of YwqJK toxin-antitoxin module
MAQSKKEQIAILTYRVDSLKREYLKDTTQLQSTIETIEREYTILSDQYDEAQELIKKKSATISEKTNTIKSLNTQNMELMENLKQKIDSNNILTTQLKTIKNKIGNKSRIKYKPRYHINETNYDDITYTCCMAFPNTPAYSGGESLRYGIKLKSTGELLTGIVYNSEPKSLFEVEYLNGSLIGFARIYSENGFLKDEYEFSKGAVPKSFRSFYENGMLSKEVIICDSIYGVYPLVKEWYDNGNVAYETKRSNRNIPTMDIRYDINGYIKEKTTYGYSEGYELQKENFKNNPGIVHFKLFENHWIDDFGKENILRTFSQGSLYVPIDYSGCIKNVYQDSVFGEVTLYEWSEASITYKAKIYEDDNGFLRPIFIKYWDSDFPESGWAGKEYYKNGVIKIERSVATAADNSNYWWAIVDLYYSNGNLKKEYRINSDFANNIEGNREKPKCWDINGIEIECD